MAASDDHVAQTDALGLGTRKLLNDCRPRELVRFCTATGTVLAIIAEWQGAEIRCLVVDSTIEGALCPVFQLLPPRIPHCLSYGTDWFLELVGDERSWSGNSTDGDQLGVVTKLPDGRTLVLAMGSEQLWPGPSFVDLKTIKKYGDPVPQGVPYFSSWKIWPSEDEAKRPNGRPIFSFPKTSSQD